MSAGLDSRLPTVSMTGERDDVDRIVAAWRRECADLDVAPLEVLSRVSRLARRLDLIRAEVFATHDLEGWEFDVLAALRRAGPPYALTPGALVHQTLVTSGTMTNRVTRLIERGLVTRSKDPRDGRGALVTVTVAGRDLVDAAMHDLVAREEQLLRQLDGPQRDALADTLRRLLVPLESSAEVPDPAAAPGGTS